jgi:hypothetical protein
MEWSLRCENLFVSGAVQMSKSQDKPTISENKTKTG